MRSAVNFPLEVMFQLKYGNEDIRKGFEDFIKKFNSIEFNELMTNSTILIGFPDELMKSKLLEKLYANLNLTEDASIFIKCIKK